MEGANPTGTVFNSGRALSSNGTTRSASSLRWRDGASRLESNGRPDNAILAVDDGEEGAVSKAALGESSSGCASRTTSAGKVEVYDDTFAEVETTTRSLIRIFRTGFALRSRTSMDSSTSPTQADLEGRTMYRPRSRYVSVFDTDGNFVKRLISRGRLSRPGA
jgi:hypothetical protein